MSLFRRNSLPIPSKDEYPTHSILLNASEKPIIKPQGRRLDIGTGSRARSGSTTSSLSISTSPSTSTSGIGVGSYRRPSFSCSTPSCSSSKVSFAPLPEVPPELKRQNSITLGVAARKNLLVQQGTAPPRAPGAGAGGNTGGVRKVYMTDEEWEQYKKAFEEKSGADAVDLGELAKSGAKNLWRKVRSSSVSSSTSNSSLQSSPGTQTSEVGSLGSSSMSGIGGGKVLASPRKMFGRRNSSNSNYTSTSISGMGASTSTSSSARATDVLGFNDSRMSVGETTLGTVVEEERSRPTSPRGGGLELDIGRPSRFNPDDTHSSQLSSRLQQTRESKEMGGSDMKLNSPPKSRKAHLPSLNHTASHRARSPPPKPVEVDEEDDEEASEVSSRKGNE